MYNFPQKRIFRIFSANDWNHPESNHFVFLTWGSYLLKRPGYTKFFSLDLGYIFEFPCIPYALRELGVVGSASFVPRSIRSAYGETPLSHTVFLRIELKDKEKRVKR